jgi:cell division protein FtsB
MSETLKRIGIGAIIAVIAFSAGTFIGTAIGSGKNSAELADADRRIAEYRAELELERQRITDLETTNRELEEGNRELLSNLSRARGTLSDISQTISRLEGIQGSAIEKLRRVIDALKAIQKAIRVSANS